MRRNLIKRNFLMKRFYAKAASEEKLAQKFSCGRCNSPSMTYSSCLGSPGMTPDWQKLSFESKAVINCMHFSRSQWVTDCFLCFKSSRMSYSFRDNWIVVGGWNFKFHFPFCSKIHRSTSDLLKMVIYPNLKHIKIASFHPVLSHEHAKFPFTSPMGS